MKNWILQKYIDVLLMQDNWIVLITDNVDHGRIISELRQVQLNLIDA